MTGLSLFQSENQGSPSLHSFSQTAFLETVGNNLYAGLDTQDPKNYGSMYKRAYEAFRHNQGKPATVTPEPLPPCEIQGDVSYEQLCELEASLGIMYSVGFGVLCHAFGRNPLRE